MALLYDVEPVYHWTLTTWFANATDLVVGIRSSEGWQEEMPSLDLGVCSVKTGDGKLRAHFRISLRRFELL
jgi:hypothetical protein